MNILFCGGGWPINVGNAFIDYGSMYMLRKAFPNDKVYFNSLLPRWFFRVNRKEMERSISLMELMDIDAVIFSGMAICDEFITLGGPLLNRLSMRGTQIVFNGCGCEIYDEKEKSNFKKFLKIVKPNAFISRDTYTYENFKNFFPKAYNGIDCAFFLSDAFNPASLMVKDYVVYTFDSIKEPKIQNSKRIIRAHHSCNRLFPLAFGNGRIALTFGTEKPFVAIRTNYGYGKPELDNSCVLISDIPDDYLHLYANAYAVYADRVHACIAALSFGNLARLYSSTPRSHLFERVGAGEITKRPVKLDLKKLAAEKEKQIIFLKETLR